jgi:hypothetical protein
MKEFFREIRRELCRFIVSLTPRRKAVEEPVNAIIDSIKTSLDRTPPELAAIVGADCATDPARCMPMSYMRIAIAPAANDRTHKATTVNACRMPTPSLGAKA